MPTGAPAFLYGSKELAAAWRDPAAWEGMTRAGGVDFPAEVGGFVALTEVVIHGWDVASATGQPYDVDADSADAVLPHVSETAARVRWRGCSVRLSRSPTMRRCSTGSSR